MSHSYAPPVVNIEDALAGDAVARWLGVVCESRAPLRLSMTVSDEHTNFHGMTHGGVVFSFADVAMSLASNAEVTALAIDAHVVLQASSRPGDRLTVTIEQMHASRRLASYRATVAGEDGPIAAFTGTCYRPPD